MTTEWADELEPTTTNSPVADTLEPVPGEAEVAAEPPATPAGWLVVDDTLDQTGHCTVSGAGLRGLDGIPVRESTQLVICVDGTSFYHVAPHGLEGEYQTAISVTPGTHLIEIRDAVSGAVLGSRSAEIT